MLSHSKSTRLRFVVTMCMLLAGGAVSMGTSCITAPKGKGAGGGGVTTGTISGTVDSSNADPISGVTVTATDSATAATVVTTTSSAGAYTLSDVPAGSGTLVVTGFASSGCTAPTTINYTLTKGGTLSYGILVPCTTNP